MRKRSKYIGFCTHTMKEKWTCTGKRCQHLKKVLWHHRQTSQKAAIQDESLDKIVTKNSYVVIFLRLFARYFLCRGNHSSFVPQCSPRWRIKHRQLFSATTTLCIFLTHKGGTVQMCLHSSNTFPPEFSASKVSFSSWVFVVQVYCCTQACVWRAFFREEVNAGI